MILKKKIFYIVEPINWVTNWEGKYITENIKNLYNVPATLLRMSRRRISRVEEQILHFGSRNTYLPANYVYVNKNNTVVLTWYHGTDQDLEYIRLLPRVSKKLDIIHTSCSITREQLIKWGAEGKKIKVIPIGIDTGLFKKTGDLEKRHIRKKLGIPDNSICVGSFQKDGNGWGEGNTPKLVKGPDIFCEVIQRLKTKYPVFVLLTGPARGYVKKRLSSKNIAFRHFYFRNYLNIVNFYKAIDLYIITSRAEGGPKALIESFASGVPVVSTDVGMVHDIAKHGHNALVSKIDDLEDLVYNCEKVIEDSSLKNKIISRGLETVKDYDWKLIAERYYKEIYFKYL